jgi:hypothetical protein
MLGMIPRSLSANFEARVVSVQHVATNALDVKAACTSQYIRAVNRICDECILLQWVILDWKQLASKDGKQVRRLTKYVRTDDVKDGEFLFVLAKDVKHQIFHPSKEPVILSMMLIDTFSLADVIRVWEEVSAVFDSRNFDPRQQVSHKTELGVLVIAPDHEQDPCLVSLSID